MDMADFDRYNPNFNEALSTGASYNLQLPDDKMKAFFEKKFDILNQSVSRLLGEVNMNSKFGSSKKK